MNQEEIFTSCEWSKGSLILDHRVTAIPPFGYEVMRLFERIINCFKEDV